MITGMIAGPFVLQVIKSQDILFLQYINMFALAFITTSAGAELEMSLLRPILKNIVISTTCISFLSFGVGAGMVLALSDTSLLTQLMDGRSDQCRVGLAMVLWLSFPPLFEPYHPHMSFFLALCFQQRSGDGERLNLFLNSTRLWAPSAWQGVLPLLLL